MVSESGEPILFATSSPGNGFPVVGKFFKEFLSVQVGCEFFDCVLPIIGESFESERSPPIVLFFAFATIVLGGG